MNSQLIAQAKKIETLEAQLRFERTEHNRLKTLFNRIKHLGYNHNNDIVISITELARRCGDPRDVAEIREWIVSV